MSSKAVSKCLGLLYAIVNTFWRWPLAREQPQILRLRARPTRKRSGSESLCGRFAQDDILKFMNNPGPGLHYPCKRIQQSWKRSNALARTNSGRSERSEEHTSELQSLRHL